MTPLNIARAAYHATISPPQLSAHLKVTKLAPGPLPLHLGKDLIGSWTAFSSWLLRDGLDGLRKDVGEDRAVEVELGRKGRGYLDENVQRVSIGFGLFLDAFILDRIPTQTSDSADMPTAYLAQSDLLDIPKVADKVPPVDQFRSGPQGAVYRRTMWIGPGRSFTPFHRDPYIGIYSQILGRKTFHVLPPQASGLLDLSTDPLQKNTSTIPIPVSSFFDRVQMKPGGSGNEDVAGVSQGGQHTALRALFAGTASADISPRSFERYQRHLDESFKLPGACVVELQAGESVLIPEGWFHSAEGGDGPGVGVGAWFR